MEFLNNLPWWGVVIFGIVLAGLVIYLVNKNVTIKLGNLSIEQQKEFVKQSEDNNIRLKIHAQIREYENYTGLIERILFQGFEKTFPDLELNEKTIIRLFCNIVRRALEKQLILDIVANHIVTKTPEELKTYTSEKVQGYQNRICNFMSSYNDVVLPNKDIMKVIENINTKELEDIYYSIYTKAVKIARQD